MRQTLPTATKHWPWGLDVVRKVIRKTPALHALGERVGATKAYSPGELEIIRQAVEDRSTARKPVAAA